MKEVDVMVLTCIEYDSVSEHRPSIKKYTEIKILEFRRSAAVCATLYAYKVHVLVLRVQVF
jgi:hypothetical protein